MRRALILPVVAAALAISTVAVGADPTEPGTRFTGTLAFGACPTDRPDLDAPRIIEPFTDPRLAGSVSITGWSTGYQASSCVWFGSWLIGDSNRGWVEVASPRLQPGDGTSSHYTSLMVGIGDNDGLLALSEVAVAGQLFEFEGRITEGDVAQVTDYSGVVEPGDIEALGW
jgi:hypothetical protein